MTLRTFLLPLVVGLASAGPADAGSQAAAAPVAAPLCVAAASSSGAAEYHCTYDGPALTARLIGLLNLRSPGLAAEAVERAFALPRLDASFADPWNANYLVLLRAASGGAEWRMLLSLRESFGPGVAGRRHHLRGTARPVRIDPRIRGEMTLDVTLYGAEPPVAADPTCLAPARIADEAVRRGWRRGVPQPLTLSHGPPLWEMELKRGDLSFTIDVTGQPLCARRLTLRQRSNAPPERGLAALRAAERRREIDRGADRIAAALARPGDPEEDPDALRAYAAFVRDNHARFETMAGNPNRDVDRQIAEMAEDEVRSLAARLAGGHPWGAAREDCEAAISDADPVASLERRGRRRGLSAPERSALRTQCHAFLEGRRFRYRVEPAPAPPPRN
ncbi:MAG TPA: hypothetical protein VF552_10650 [Allosphingosinicella sp.]